jgi:hypothetical protein
MSELEPTITELEPTATERLRALLDERGVEWDADDEAMDDGSLSQVTYWYCNGIEWSADGRDEYLAFDAVQLLTPEQAIAATLGREDIYTREDMEGAFVSGYSLGSLPVGSDPRWDENRQTVDEHMAELGWVRKEAAMLDDSDATEARRSDAVEVVRCRDCACFSVDDSDHDYRTGWWCKRLYTDMVMPDGFCAWGVRREGK